MQGFSHRYCNGIGWTHVRAILLPQCLMGMVWEAYENGAPIKGKPVKMLPSSSKIRRVSRYPSGTSRDSGPSFLRLRIWASIVDNRGGRSAASIPRLCCGMSQNVPKASPTPKSLVDQCLSVHFQVKLAWASHITQPSGMNTQPELLGYKPLGLRVESP